MTGTEFHEIYDDVNRQIITKVYLLDKNDKRDGVAWKGVVGYPMSHHVDDLGCDMRCTNNAFLDIKSCTLCMEGGIKWQDPKNRTENQNGK